MIYIFFYLVFSYRFHGFCVSILLVSLIVTTFKRILYEKKKMKQISLGTQRPPSVALVELPFLNVISANDSMISLITVFIFSSVSLIFLTILTLYSRSVAGTLYYHLIICFYLSFTITPPLYFFKRIGKFKIAIDIVCEMFN